MPRADDRVARALARTQEALPEDEPPSERVVVVNNEEMDIDKIVQKVRERVSSPRKSPKPPSERPPLVPSPRNTPSPKKSYVERATPRSPSNLTRIPVTDMPTVEIIPEPVERKVSATTFSYRDLRKSTRDELDTRLQSMNSQQLRNEIMKLRSEKSSKKSTPPRTTPPVYYDHPPPPSEEKIPVYDEERGTYVLWPKHKFDQYAPQQRPRYPQQYQPHRRGTTRDAYPTKTYDENVVNDDNQPQNTLDIVAVNDNIVEESTDIDFDSMTDVQRREFLNEMKMKFSVFRKNYPNFPIPVIQDDDNPRWVFGIYEQLLDMAKSDASQPIYQTGLQIVFLVLQVVLTVSGVPAKNFFSFHAKNFAKYNTLMAELGEKWGPIIDVTSSIETKLALAIGWNTLVYAIVSVVGAKFGDRWGTSVEQMLDKLTTSTTNNQKMENLERELSGRTIDPGSEAPPPPETSGGGDSLGGLANLLGGLLGGGGGTGNLLGNLLGAFTGGGGAGQTGVSSTERRPPTYDD